jgi:hypothetical protein
MRITSSCGQDLAVRIKGRKRAALLCVAAGLAFWPGATMFAQTIQPVISEYTVKADGRFDLTNDTLTPVAVVLEPKSFSIGLDGKGTFRPLDPSIHVELSTMSVRLEPHQTYYVFYKAHANTLPAWFTVYAVFSPIQKGDGVKVRIMLPHTVYLYQKKTIAKEAIDVQNVAYLTGRDTIVCDLDNLSPSLVRVQEVSVAGGKAPVLANGFPLLPHSPRHLEIPWKQASPPSYVVLHFPHFDVKEPVSVKDQ